MADTPEQFEDARSNFTPNQGVNNDDSTPGNDRTYPPRTLFRTSTSQTSTHAGPNIEANIGHNDDDVVVAQVIPPGTPQYLQQEQSHLQPLDLGVVAEEALEVGDGDSAASANEINEIDQTFEESKSDRLQVIIKLEDDGEDAVRDNDVNYTPFGFEGLDEKTSLPQVPADWKRPPPKSNEPKDFEDVDNPGGWNEFTYRPKFYKPKKGDKKAPGLKKGDYLHHALPTGATVVKEDDNGIRKVGDWHFH